RAVQRPRHRRQPLTLADPRRATRTRTTTAPRTRTQGLPHRTRTLIPANLEPIAKDPESIKSEGGVRVHAGHALDEPFTPDDAGRPHPEPLHHHPRGRVGHLG